MVWALSNRPSTSGFTAEQARPRPALSTPYTRLGSQQTFGATTDCWQRMRQAMPKGSWQAGLLAARQQLEQGVVVNALLTGVLALAGILALPALTVIQLPVLLSPVMYASLCAMDAVKGLVGGLLPWSQPENWWKAVQGALRRG